MSGGAYIALSGLRTRVDQLDRISSDLANVNTSGYKAERVTTTSVRRPNFEQSLETAIDVAAAPGFIDFANGQIETTNRDLDLALEGKGFFVDRHARRPALHARRPASRGAPMAC